MNANHCDFYITVMDITFSFNTYGAIPKARSLYYNRLMGHENSYVTELRNPLNVTRRLKRQWPSDLKGQKEEEE
jgi:hypothetical protein